MPNIVGGDQQHPAYKPRKLKPNEALVGEDFYCIRRVRGEVRVFCENVDGSSWDCLATNKGLPPQVKRKVTILEKEYKREKAKKARARAKARREARYW